MKFISIEDKIFEKPLMFNSITYYSNLLASNFLLYRFNLHHIIILHYMSMKIFKIRFKLRYFLTLSNKNKNVDLNENIDKRYIVIKNMS